ncbi:hypothetical protein L9F63_009884, partial [Diploptera punctata]
MVVYFVSVYCSYFILFVLKILYKLYKYPSIYNSTRHYLITKLVKIFHYNHFDWTLPHYETRHYLITKLVKIFHYTTLIGFINLYMLDDLSLYHFDRFYKSVHVGWCSLRTLPHYETRLAVIYFVIAHDFPQNPGMRLSPLPFKKYITPFLPLLWTWQIRRRLASINSYISFCIFIFFNIVYYVASETSTSNMFIQTKIIFAIAIATLFFKILNKFAEKYRLTIMIKEYEYLEIHEGFGILKKDILSDMPKHLKDEINIDMCTSAIKQVKYFEQSVFFYLPLARLCIYACVLPNNTVYHELELQLVYSMLLYNYQ